MGQKGSSVPTCIPDTRAYMVYIAQEITIAVTHTQLGKHHTSKQMHLLS